MFLARRRPQDVVVGWRRRSRQRARVLTAVKARRYAPPPLRGADGLDGGSAHALQTGLVRRRNKHDPLHIGVDDLFGMARFSALVDTLLPDDDDRDTRTAAQSALRAVELDQPPLVALLVGLVTAVATYIPARRAASVEPTVALRE